MMSRMFWYGLLILVQVLGAAYQVFLLLTGYTGIGEYHPVIGFALTQIVVWLAFQVSLTVLIMRNEEKIEGFLPYSVLLALSMFWPEALPIGIYGSGVMVVCFQILSFAILVFLIGKVDCVRFCSSIRKETTWYPMVPLVSLGVTILQFIDRIPVVLRFWNIMDHSKPDFYLNLFEVVDQEVLLVILLTCLLAIKNKKFRFVLSCLYCSVYVPSVLLKLLVLKTTSPIPFSILSFPFTCFIDRREVYKGCLEYSQAQILTKEILQVEMKQSQLSSKKVKVVWFVLSPLVRNLRHYCPISFPYQND